MKHSRSFSAVIIIIIVGLVIILNHNYNFWSRTGNGKSQTGQKFSDAGNQPDKTPIVSPLPSVSPKASGISSQPPQSPANGSQANDRAPSASPAASQPSVQPSSQSAEKPASQPTAQQAAQPSSQTGAQSAAPTTAQPSAPAVAQPSAPAAETLTETPNTTKIPDAIPKAVEEKAGTIAKGEVQTDDFLKVASLLIGKLSLTEIKYLFDSASDDYWAVTPLEEIEKARSILFSKLSADDLNQLYALGKKYGRSMSIIDPNLDVADAKARQVKAWEEKNKQAQQP